MKPLILPVLILMLSACASVAAPPSDRPRGEGPASTENSGTDAMVARGAAFAAANCSGCHALGATGNSPHPRAPAFRDIGKRYPVDELSEAFAEGIVTAHPDMPEFILTPDDNRAVIAYLKSVQTVGRPASADRTLAEAPNS
ncbi:c-type cytochrome [Brevundimonas variabilis]|uniref:Mono/diheme cytochrome c family protein n=1 Tax=Brevundimonas variabilis TaxID=74312 RepID=A0A7W9CK67_9CAUL|nr:mono/diheme cytochrome c family protein [Brevundimonas variabilis]